MPDPSEQHPLDHPFAFALIQLDGATTPLLHAVDAGSPEEHGRGQAGWRPAGGAPAVGRIDDIVCFVPGETPETEGRTPGRPRSR